MTTDQAGEDIDERVHALEERVQVAETRATKAEEVADRVFTLAGLAQWIRDGSSRTLSAPDHSRPSPRWSMRSRPISRRPGQ